MQTPIEAATRRSDVCDLDAAGQRPRHRAARRDVVQPVALVVVEVADELDVQLGAVAVTAARAVVGMGGMLGHLDGDGGTEDGPDVSAPDPLAGDGWGVR